MPPPVRPLPPARLHAGACSPTWSPGLGQPPGAAAARRPRPSRCWPQCRAGCSRWWWPRPLRCGGGEQARGEQARCAHTAAQPCARHWLVHPAAAPPTRPPTCRPLLHQLPHHCQVALAGRVVQCSRPRQVALVQRAARLEQQHHRQVPCQRGLVQRTLAVARLLVHVAACAQQRRHDLGVPRRRGVVQRQPAIGVLGRDGQPPRGQHLVHELQMALLRSQVQRGAPLGLRAAVSIQQQRRALGVAVLRCQLHWGLPVLITQLQQRRRCGQRRSARSARFRLAGRSSAPHLPHQQPHTRHVACGHARSQAACRQ